MTHDNDIDFDFEPAPPDKLYAHNRRQLSAMLDGELSPDQARFMLRRLQHDGELAACWERWQVCGDVLRGRGHALLPADFSRRVAAAIAAPAGERAVADAAGARPGREHRLVRWGGGALAASMALVALFMARPLPDQRAPALVEAAGAARPAPALAQDAPVVADAGGALVLPAPAPVSDGSRGRADLLAAAAPLAVAVPRRAADRSSTRSQAQRATVRRSQAGVETPTRAVAAAAPPPAAAAQRTPAPATSADGLPAYASIDPAAQGDVLFGALPTTTARPWPRAVLPGLSRTQPFAAGYGLPQAEAFAPFQPRLEGDAIGPAVLRFAPPRPAADGKDAAPEPRPDGAYSD
jgi:negative regulator of sigma E activity